MTCRDKEALRLERLTQPQLDAWILHAETCLDCAPLLRDVSESYQRLRAPVPPPTPERTAALWRAIEAQARMAPRPREVRPLWPAALFASAALAAALLWSSGPTAPSPETVYTALAAGEAIPIGAATLRASTAATVRVVEDPPLTRVFVASGDVELDAPALVDPSRTNVETPHVSLVRVAGRVSLSVEPDHTRLHVRVGEVHTEAGVEYQADTTVTFPEVFGQGGARDRVAPAPTPSVGAPPIAEAPTGEVAAIAPAPKPTDADVPKRRTPPSSEAPPAPASDDAAPAVREAAPPPPPRPDEAPPAPDDAPGARPRLETEAPVQERIDEARRLVRKDAKAAQAMAEAVLEERPPPRQEVEALLVLADASRRSGAYEVAAEHYAAVAEHPAGAAYREEAGLRRAQLLEHLGRPREALALLEAAAAAYPQGGLRPEREAMRARLLLEGGRAAEAAAVLEGCTDQRTAHVLHEMRVRIADALLAADPARARALAEVVATAKVPAELRAEAERVIAASTRGDSSP